MFSHFPKYKYHPIHIMKLIKTAEEEIELGEGWFESPAHFPVAVENAVKETEAFVTKTATKGKRK